MAHQKQSNWLDLAGEFGSSLYDVLSLQTDALKHDVAGLKRRVMSNIASGIALVLMAFSGILFASMALATVIARNTSWAVALCSIAAIHFGIAITLYFLRKSLFTKPASMLPYSTHVFATVRDSVLHKSSDAKGSRDGTNDSTTA